MGIGSLGPENIPHQPNPDNSSYIERIDISDGNSHVMGMATGQSFYKLTKVSNIGSPSNNNQKLRAPLTAYPNM
jgi:hypothetical protein